MGISSSEPGFVDFNTSRMKLPVRLVGVIGERMNREQDAYVVLGGSPWDTVARFGGESLRERRNGNGTSSSLIRSPSVLPPFSGCYAIMFTPLFSIDLGWTHHNFYLAYLGLLP